MSSQILLNSELGGLNSGALVRYLQHVDEDHGVGDVPVELLLLGHVRQVDERPGHDAGATVEEQLEVEPLADARVEFDAHHEVIDEVPREFAAQKTAAAHQQMKENPPWR